MDRTDAFVLIVDDEEAVRKSISRLLSSEGIEFVAVSTAEDALSLLQVARAGGLRLPALILLDLGLPGMTAEEFRRCQLGDPLLADIPVVVVSASPRAKERAEALGAIAVILKPVDVDRFVPIVRSVIADRFR